MEGLTVAWRAGLSGRVGELGGDAVPIISVTSINEESKAWRVKKGAGGHTSKCWRQTSDLGGVAPVCSLRPILFFP